MTKTVATAEQFYVDPSALLKLYLNEHQSRAMSAWRAKQRGSLQVTHHGRVEIINALSLALHRTYISATIHAAALNAVEDDLAQGRNRLANIAWRTVLNTAAEISRLYTASTGCRTLDVIHVASALELDLKRFVTYDERQKKLATAVGLKVVTPG
jgi:predicted nucleic acid-binding protein